MKPADFFAQALPAAKASGHIFPEYACCEAALESAWGESGLCRKANNLFGQKQGFTTEGYPTITIPTKEFIHGQWIWVDAVWPRFSSWADSFKARMVLLQSMTAYGPALQSQNGEDFINTVSKIWATDPERAKKVLMIYNAHKQDLGVTT